MSFRRRARSLSPAARRHLPRLLAAGWQLQVIPAHTAHGVDWRPLVILELPATAGAAGDSNFEARGQTVAQAVAVARGTSPAVSFWVPGETSGADFETTSFRGDRRLRRVKARLDAGRLIHPRDASRARTVAGWASP